MCACMYIEEYETEGVVVQTSVQTTATHSHGRVNKCVGKANPIYSHKNHRAIGISGRQSWLIIHTSNLKVDQHPQALLSVSRLPTPKQPCKMAFGWFSSPLIVLIKHFLTMNRVVILRKRKNNFAMKMNFNIACIYHCPCTGARIKC